MQNTPAYRARRRLFEQNFRSNVAPKYQERQVQVTIKMLLNILETPEQYSEHIYQYVIHQRIFASTYFYTLAQWDRLSWTLSRDMRLNQKTTNGLQWLT